MRETFKVLRTKIEVALNSLYLQRAFKESLSEQSNVDKINLNAEFWQCIEISLNTQIFISLRRLYENGVDTFNF